jgi:hypothetical protein
MAAPAVFGPPVSSKDRAPAATNTPEPTIRRTLLRARVLDLKPNAMNADAFDIAIILSLCQLWIAMHNVFWARLSVHECKEKPV